MAGIQFDIKLKRRDFDLDATLELPGRGITVIFGPSGCGKTTLLRCLAGLEKNAQGTIKVNSQLWQSHEAMSPTHKRSLGMVFQEASLLPHLTAQGNLDYAIKRSITKPSMAEFDKVINIMGIASILPKHPAHLSGGERQRVAIARALLTKPELLLMDEPLASLDEARKNEILPYLEKIKTEFSLPIIYVTHSVEEMARLADYLVVIQGGRVIKQGGALALFSELNLPFQMGDQAGVVIESSVTASDPVWGLDQVAMGDSYIHVPHSDCDIGQSVRLRILAKDVSITLSEHKDSSILNRLPARVIDVATDKMTNGAFMRLIRLDVSGYPIIARITARSAEQLDLKPGCKVWVQIKSAAIVR